MPRAALREEEIQDFRDRVVEVASALFVERGYEGVTFRALAEGLGCSPMTPYRYFQDKDDIFAALRAAAYNRFAAALEAASPATLEPLERVEEIGRAYVRFGVDDRDAYQLMFALRQANPENYPELRAAEERSWTPLYSAVEAAVHSGDLVGDAEELAQLCWAGVHGIVSLHLAGKLVLPSLAALVEPMVRTIVAGNQERSAKAPNTLSR
jgi:AcrR family transcriptional regulator